MNGVDTIMITVFTSFEAALVTIFSKIEQVTIFTHVAKRCTVMVGGKFAKIAKIAR